MKSFVRKSIAIITICVIAFGLVGCGATHNTTNDSSQSNSAKANGEKPFIPNDINRHLNFYADYGEDVNSPQYRFVYSMNFDGTSRYDIRSCRHVIGLIVEHYT